MNQLSENSAVELTAGDFFLELVFERPISADNLISGMAMAGFSEIIVDLPTKKSTSELLPENEVVRVIAKLDIDIAVTNINGIRWKTCHKLAFDPFTKVPDNLVPHTLRTDELYELRFLARIVKQATKENVFEALKTMGWQPVQLSLLKHNMRLPNRPGASVTLWMAMAKWTGPMSYISEEDPFFFGEVVQISNNHPSQEMEVAEERVQP